MAPRPGSSHAGTSAENVRPSPGTANSETSDSTTPFSSKTPASFALCSRVAASSPVNPIDSLASSTTRSTVPASFAIPEKTAPNSNSRASRTSRFRLCASVVTIPGTSEGRSSRASSESGFSIAMGSRRPPSWASDFCEATNTAPSASDANELEIASE